MSQKNFLIVIGGATATGKTHLSLRLARHFQTEILSCDSRQFYREMTIGTAKPTPEELAAAPHHFINSLSIATDYSVGDFERDALAVLDKIYDQKNVAIMVGGSGLYIRAVCEGLDDFPEVPKEVQQAVQKLFDSKGIAALQTELKYSDPLYYEKVDLQNPVRLIRALSVIRSSGQPFSSFHQKEKVKRSFIPIYINVVMDREKLYEKINQRVDWMVEAGLLDEAKSLRPFQHKNALQTVGYQELMEFFNQKTDLDSAIDLIKRNTRRYAKRQMTWFRKDPHWQNFEADDYEAILDYINGQLIDN